MLQKNIYRRILSLSVLLLLCLHSFSQSRVISGKISDDKGAAVAGATVTAIGSSVVTLTDATGSFTVSVPSTATSLSVSSVGFTEQVIPLGDKTFFAITLLQDVRSLNDVVVVGYGTVRKKDVTGAVSNITQKDFSTGVISNPLQQIQGKVAGLVITQPGGDPNGNLIIRLRGQTSLSGGQTPLIVLDGIPLDDPNQISSIAPGDIASYDVLKDVSATAIYGSRGANGVIIINTKKGAAGRTRVEYNGYYAVDKLTGNFDLLSASEWRAAVQTIPGIDPSTIAGLDKGGNTDWLKAITRTANTNSHNVSITGGTGSFNYRASVNYMNQQGIVINTGKEQLGLRFVGEQKALNDKLTIQVGLAYTQNKRKYADYNIFDYVNTTPPVYPVYNPDGSYFGYYDYDQQNPVAQQMLETNTGTEALTQLYGRVDYELLKGLKVGTFGSISRFNLQSQYFQPELPGVGNINQANQLDSNLNSTKGDIHINFNRDFGKSNLNAVAVYEYNDFISSDFGASGQNYLLPALGANSLGGGNPALNLISSEKQEYKLISFLGRVGYNYDSKYYVTASFRRDGSSKFGANNRWGNFPSVSVAWRLKNESFLQNVSWLNDLKINAGYGVVGNQDAITPYGSTLLLGAGGRYYNPGSATYPYPQSYTPVQNANPDLKWEERHGKNIGLDFALFGNRLSGNFNVFNDKTKNLLFTYNVPVPPFFYNTILANVGELTNKGIEFQLSAEVIKTRDFSWQLGGQITTVKTRITSLSGSYAGNKISSDQVPVGYAVGRGYDGNAITYLKVGYSPYVFYLAQFAGLSDTVSNESNSNQLYYDANGKKITDVTAAAKKYTDPSPNFTYGISNTFNYKQVSLNFFLRGVHGQKLFNDYSNIVSNISRLPGNNVTHDALTNGIKGSQTASDLWLQNASYLRLDNATLSYRFSNIKGLESLRVYVTGSNLFVITPYKGIDPEIRSGNTNQAYIDQNVYGDAFYPRSKTYTIGVNVAFK